MRATWYEDEGAPRASSAMLIRVTPSLASLSLRRQKKTGPGESKKTAGFLAQESRMQHDPRRLSRAACMLLLCQLKERRLIAGPTLPHGKDDAHPHVCQGADCHAMGLALSSFALIIGSCPAFLSRRLPGKLVENVAQRLQASETFVRFGEIATLERHRSGSCQGLHGTGIGVSR